MTMKFKEKLLNVQKNLIAQKAQYNSFGKYKYRSTEDILESLKPLLYEYKLTQVLTDEIIMIGERIYVKATAKVYDTETDDFMAAYAYAREPKELKGMSESQVTGATSSYARKYALNGLYAIDDTKDADTNEYHNEINNQVKNEEKTQQNSNKNRLATDSEIAYIFKINKNITYNQIKEIVKKVTGKETTKLMTISQVNEVISELKKYHKTK